MIPPYPVYLFDVDGTLLDSAADICGAVSEVLRTTPAAGVEQVILRTYIGKHLYELFADLIPGSTEAEHEAWLAAYRKIYLSRLHAGTRVYPGVADALSRLGGRKSTATTKSTSTVRAILEQFGLLHNFDHVQGTDGFPAKPAPDVILRSLQALDADPRDVLFVGDSEADIAAGRAAGVRTCAVRYGYGNLEAMARQQPDYWIDDLGQLLS